MTAKIQIAEPGTSTHASSTSDPGISIASSILSGAGSLVTSQYKTDTPLEALAQPPVTEKNTAVQAGASTISSIPGLIASYGIRLLEIVGGGAILIFGLVILARSHPGGDV